MIICFQWRSVLLGCSFLELGSRWALWHPLSGLFWILMPWIIMIYAIIDSYVSYIFHLELDVLTYRAMGMIQCWYKQPSCSWQPIWVLLLEVHKQPKSFLYKKCSLCHIFSILLQIEVFDDYKNSAQDSPPVLKVTNILQTAFTNLNTHDKVHSHV